MSLASMTTLGVGGAAERVVQPLTEGETVDLIRACVADDLPLYVLGGGSNVVISDRGLGGLVMRSEDFHFSVKRDGDDAIVEAGAGVEWDELVAFTVTEGLAGLECLSGIPGRVGAAPIQNIGAYGQEVAERVESVRTIDRATGEVETLAADACGFGYRTSHFKTTWRDQRVVSRVRFRLRAGGEPTLRYPELQRALGVRPDGPAPELEMVRKVVLKIRRRKSMVYDTNDSNHRSAGSFFTNPIVDAATADAANAAADLADDDAMPRWDVDGGVKLSAAWLIERAGFERGFAFGRAGLSTRHTLAVINRGGARASDIVALAAILRRGVRSTFGVTLHPEPVFLGFDDSPDTLLG